MLHLKYLSFKIIKYNLIHKFLYKNIKKIPNISKVIVFFKTNINNFYSFICCLLALKILLNKQVSLILAQNHSISFKIKKGEPIGCKVIFVKKGLTRFLTENFSNTVVNNSKLATYFYFYFVNLSKDVSLWQNYSLFNNLPKLKVLIVTNTKTCKELRLLLNSFKLF